MKIQETIHTETSSKSGAYADTHMLSVSNYFGAAPFRYFLTDKTYVFHKVTWWGKILMPSGIYVYLNPDDIILQGTWTNGTIDPTYDNSNYLRSDIIYDIPLGSDFEGMDGIYHYRGVVLPDGGGTPQETLGTTVYIYATWFFKRIELFKNEY
jgi:hypothetical protein